MFNDPSSPQYLSPEAIDQLPLAVFTGEIVEIKSPRAAREAVQELSRESILGFDTETRPNFAPPSAGRHKTALLQLASGNKSFLFRLTYCGFPDDLADLLGNPRVLKVGAAIKEDIRGLQVHHTFSPSGFVDLQTLAESLGITVKSLKKMAAIVLGLRLSKGQQLSNWENRELSPSQRQYAALDAWICREIYLKLRNSFWRK
ncbi:MAG: 3'-5' exonuclease domain-containing protein 2 [Bacteroidales bacterium]|nr:3'-5' exonuclease domain-containing protein 2 [Bacteroidales bacterium]